MPLGRAAVGTAAFPFNDRTEAVAMVVVASSGLVKVGTASVSVDDIESKASEDTAVIKLSPEGTEITTDDGEPPLSANAEVGGREEESGPEGREMTTGVEEAEPLVPLKGAVELPSGTEMVMPPSPVGLEVGADDGADDGEEVIPPSPPEGADVGGELMIVVLSPPTGKVVGEPLSTELTMELMTELAPVSTLLITELAPVSTLLITEEAPEAILLITESPPEATELTMESTPDRTELTPPPRPERIELSGSPVGWESDAVLPLLSVEEGRLDTPSPEEGVASGVDEGGARMLLSWHKTSRGSQVGCELSDEEDGVGVIVAGTEESD